MGDPIAIVGIWAKSRLNMYRDLMAEMEKMTRITYENETKKLQIGSKISLLEDLQDFLDCY